MINHIVEQSETFGALTDACQYFLRTLPQAEECRKYIDSRISRDTQTKFNIGYFPENENLDQLFKMVDKKSLEKYNILYSKNVSGGKILNSHFGEHNLVMPFRDVHGNIISIMGRTLLPEEEQKENKIQKYKYSKDTDKNLYVYGLDSAKSSIIAKNSVICVEGQFDCIACRNVGIDNVVALGWSTLSRYQYFQISKYTKNIYLMFDNDEAGKLGAKKAKTRFGEFSKMKIIHVPNQFKDIDEFIRKENDTSFKDDVINKLKSIGV